VRVSGSTSLAVLAVLLLTHRQPGLGQSLTSNSTAQGGLSQQLKAFLAAPPPVEMLAEVQGFSPDTNYYVLLRYQTNAFFYREVPTLADLSSPNPLPGYRVAGYYDEDYWSFSTDGRTFESAPQGSESMRQTLNHVVNQASRVLNLGVFGALPRDIRWDGKRILAFTNRYRVSHEGELIQSPNGLPEALDLLTQFETNVILWRIDYEFSPNSTLPEYFPNKITGYSLHNGLRHTKFVVRYIEVNLPKTPFSKENFSPGAMAAGSTHQILHAPSGSALSKSRIDSTWHRVYRGPWWFLKVLLKMGLSSDTAALCWDILLWCAGLGGLLFLALWLITKVRKEPSLASRNDK
jgi:hypothetical protein